MLLIVTPANSAVSGFYDVSATAQSQANPAVSAVVTASLEVTTRGVGVDIQPQSGTIDPTQVNTWQVTVTNLGTVADSYVLTATGLVALSAQFTPATVTLNPGQSQAVQLTASDLSFALPGTYQFAVWVRSQADGRIQNEDRAEFTLTGYEAVEAAWLPTSQTVTDTLSATFLLVVTNTGNLLTPYHLAVDAAPLSHNLPVAELPIPPHTVAAIPVTVRAVTSGTYTIDGLAVSDSGLASASVTATLTVVLLEQPLSVDAGLDQAADEGSPGSFEGSASVPQSSLVAIHWDLGDGAAITGTLTLTHTYVEDGAYLVTLTVTDTLGAIASDGLTVTVSNVAPTVDAGPDQEVDAWQPLDFAGTFTDPGTLDTHTILWDFGDGGTAGGTLTPTHTYTQSSIFTVTLTITDDDGGVGQDELSVTVVDAPLVVYVGPDQAADEGTVIDFAGVFTDLSGLPPYTIAWSFGDGVTVTGTLTPSHAYADDGPYTVVLTVSNHAGVESTDSLTVTVSNVAPAVDAGPDQVVDVGQPVSFSGVFTDPGTLDVHTVAWSFGDGIIVSGTLTPTHTYSQPDLYTVTLTVTDDDGGVGTDSLVVTAERSSYFVYLPMIVRQK